MRHRWIALTCLALLIASALPAHAQPQDAPLRVGVVVRASAPERLDADLTAAALRQVETALDSVRGLRLVDHAALVSAQQRLGITLNVDSSARDLSRVAQLLDLDRLVVVEVRLSERFSVAASGLVFNPATDRAFAAAVRASGPELDAVLARALGGLVQALLPAL